MDSWNFPTVHFFDAKKWTVESCCAKIIVSLSAASLSRKESLSDALPETARVHKSFRMHFHFCFHFRRTIPKSTCATHAKIEQTTAPSPPIQCCASVKSCVRVFFSALNWGRGGDRLFYFGVRCRGGQNKTDDSSKEK